MLYIQLAITKTGMSHSLASLGWMVCVYICLLLPQICDYLNRYVIGQQHTKRVLSVAVYNHYKRLSNNLTLPRTVADNRKGEKALQTDELETVIHSTKRITFLNDKPGIIEDTVHRHMFTLSIHVGIVNLYLEDFQEAASDQNEELEEDFSPNQLMHNNHKFMLDKSNILLMGPTGSGVCSVYALVVDVYVCSGMYTTLCDILCGTEL